MFNTKERHALYTSREERERTNRIYVDVTLHNTNVIHIDTLIVDRFMRNCHDENNVKDTLLYNDMFRCTE